MCLFPISLFILGLTICDKKKEVHGRAENSSATHQDSCKVVRALPGNIRDGMTASEILDGCRDQIQSGFTIYSFVKQHISSCRLQQTYIRLPFISQSLSFVSGLHQIMTFNRKKPYQLNSSESASLCRKLGASRYYHWQQN
jgi:hypothetical protein